jgi:hypothetical protein
MRVEYRSAALSFTETLCLVRLGHQHVMLPAIPSRSRLVLTTCFPLVVLAEICRVRQKSFARILRVRLLGHKKGPQFRYPLRYSIA